MDSVNTGALVRFDSRRMHANLYQPRSNYEIYAQSMGYTLNLGGTELVPNEPAVRPNGDHLRVMFDPQIFCHQRFGGISRYAASPLSDLDHVYVYVRCCAR
jgi:hypothetical protein